MTNKFVNIKKLDVSNAQRLIWIIGMAILILLSHMSGLCQNFAIMDLMMIVGNICNNLTIPTL